MLNDLMMNDLQDEDFSVEEETANNEETENTEKEPSADPDLSLTLDSVERMLAVASNEEVLRNLLDVLNANDGLSDNSKQIFRLNTLKNKIEKRLGNTASVLENADCAATTSASIASIPTSIGDKKGKKKKPIKRPLIGVDVMNFMECIRSNVPASLKIGKNKVESFYNDKNNSMFITINECVLPTYDKLEIVEVIKDLCQRDEIPESLLNETITPTDYMILTEDAIADQNKALEPTTTDKADKTMELNNEVGKQNIVTIDKNVDTSGTTQQQDDLKANQELVGIDDSDTMHKKYVLKDPKTGKISVKKQDEIEIQNEAYSYYPKKHNKVLPQQLEETLGYIIGKSANITNEINEDLVLLDDDIWGYLCFLKEPNTLDKVANYYMSVDGSKNFLYEDNKHGFCKIIDNIYIKYFQQLKDENISSEKQKIKDFINEVNAVIRHNGNLGGVDRLWKGLRLIIPNINIEQMKNNEYRSKVFNIIKTVYDVLNFVDFSVSNLKYKNCYIISVDIPHKFSTYLEINKSLNEMDADITKNLEKLCKQCDVNINKLVNLTGKQIYTKFSELNNYHNSEYISKMFASVGINGVINDSHTICIVFDTKSLRLGNVVKAY